MTQERLEFGELVKKEYHINFLYFAMADDAEATPAPDNVVDPSIDDSEEAESKVRVLIFIPLYSADMLRPCPSSATPFPCSLHLLTIHH